MPKKSKASVVIKKEPDALEGFLGSIRGIGGRESGFPTTASIEKALTDGPLPERTDLKMEDTGAIVYLRHVAANLGVPEYAQEADLWQQAYISLKRQGRQEFVTALVAKIQREVELATIEAKKQAAQGGRERGP